MNPPCSLRDLRSATGILGVPGVQSGILEDWNPTPNLTGLLLARPFLARGPRQP
jgi:hypothetical protein